MADHSDKKSIMMYVMCYFQVLSKPHKVADDFSRVGNDVRNWGKFLRSLKEHYFYDSTTFSNMVVYLFLLFAFSRVFLHGKHFLSQKEVHLLHMRRTFQQGLLLLLFYFYSHCILFI